MRSRESFLAHDKKAIEKWIDEVVVRYQQKMGNVTLPIDEQKLVTTIEELKGVKIELKEREKVSVHKSEGILMPKRGGFILEYGFNPYKGREKISNPVARKRFTICHELGHIFFYSCDYIIPKLSITPREDVCNEIARKLLLPKEAVKKKFNEEYNSNNNLIPFLRKFAREAKVSLYPLVIRLTEDLSLLEDVMITFWRCTGDISQPDVRYEDFTPDSKTCPELRKFLPKYWRRCIHIKAWDEVVREVAIKGIALSKNSLCIEGKRRNKGKLKHILFDIECETWMDLSDQQPLLKWVNQAYNAISVEKFDLSTLKKGR